MELKTPEISLTENITLLTKGVTEFQGFGNEITVRADNLGENKWKEMLEATKNDGRERGINIFYNLLTKKFIAGNIISGTKEGFKTGKDVQIESSDIGLQGLLSDHVISVHTHPLTEQDAHLKTSIPSGNDFRTFIENSYSAMVVIDRGGAHLIIRIMNRVNDELPSPDFVQKKIDEAAEKKQTVSDVQKQLNSMISQYGIEYFYTENLTPSQNKTITFKKP